VYLVSQLNGFTQMLKVAQHRVYSDFFMPSRFDDLDRLLRIALDCGYETHSIISFWQLLKNAGLARGKKYLILRHDIDTDPLTASRMWEAEQKYGVVSSFYFRLSTLSPSLMKEMHESGVEASYHYEEVATVSKEKGLATAKEVDSELSYIRERFKSNLLRLREQTGLPMLTAASHGDFVNRKLRIANTVILADQVFRDEVNIIVEAYDRALVDPVTSRHSDKAYPVFWSPDDPLNAFRKGTDVVYILLHPRQWRAMASYNLLDNAGRMWQGIRYRLATAARS